MSLDWLKSISARIGVEGRNTIIVSGLAFCGFGLWVFLRDYDHHLWVSLTFLAAFFLLGASAILIGLLRQPQPSEVAQKFLLQQIGQQIFYAGGLQSSAELVELLRTAHNIHPLPPPSAIVLGSATRESDYKEIQQSEADDLVRKDRDGVRHNLEQEAEQIKSVLGVKSLLSEILKLGQSGSQQRNAASAQSNADSSTPDQSAMVKPPLKRAP